MAKRNATRNVLSLALLILIFLPCCFALALRSVTGSRTVYIFPHDGCLVNSVREKCRIALRVAQRQWPQQFTSKLSDDTGWILNKMEAVSHKMTNDGPLSSWADLCLLSRLVVQEQELDENRNTGRGGKYGSIYHPSSPPLELESLNESKLLSSLPPVGSRPLTVAEISENWIDGGQIRDTIRVKYNINKKDPIPILSQKLVEELASMNQSGSRDDTLQKLPMNSEMKPLFNTDDPNRRLIVLFDHECRADAELKKSNKIPTTCNVKRLHTLEETRKFVTSRNNDDSDSRSQIAFVASDTSDSRYISRLVHDWCQDHVKICVIHSSLPTLKQLTMLFGDDSPLLREGYGQVQVNGKDASRCQLGLFLSGFSDCTSPNCINGAEMDPWIGRTVNTAEDVARLMGSHACQSAFQ